MKYKIGERKRKMGRCFFWKAKEDVLQAKEYDEDDYEIVGWWTYTKMLRDIYLLTLLHYFITIFDVVQII